MKPFAEFRTFLDDQIQGYFEKLKEHRKALKLDDQDIEFTEKADSIAEINALRNDIFVFQEANKNLHKKIKKLEEENKSLKERILRFLNESK